MSGQALAQDGLQRFERDIKPQLELDSFTYGSARALGNAGFVLNDVVAVIPATPQTGDKPSTVRIERITVEEFDFQRVPPAPPKGKARQKTAADDDMPRFARIRVEGITGDEDTHNMLAPPGLPRVPLDAALDYRLDTASKVLTVNKIELALRGLTRFELSLVLDNVSDKASKLQGAKDESRLRSAALVIEDKGLFATLLPAIAEASGSTVELLVAMAQAPLGGLAAEQGPEGMAALDAVASFIADWKAPKGPIRIAIKPPSATGMEDIAKAFEPDGLTKVLGLTAFYDGTRPGAAKSAAAPAPPAAAAKPKEAGSDARLTGRAAWEAAIGNTLTGESSGTTFHEFVRDDGTTSLVADGDVTAGIWTIEGGDKVCFKYGDEEKTCYAIVVNGDEVTLTDSDGTALRATLLPGNPKDL